MSRTVSWAVAASLGAFLLVAAPMEAQGQRSGVEVWTANCGRCHTIQTPDRYTAKDWASIGTHMSITARLTDDQSEAVLAFLTSGAMGREAEASAASTRVRAYRGAMPLAAPQAPLEGEAPFLATEVEAHQSVVRVASQDPLLEEAATIFQQMCSACHGSGGQGDGPAAVAFNPRPADFTTAEFWEERTDAELDSLIAVGNKVMPPFGATMGPAVRQALVRYLRTSFQPKVALKSEGSGP